MVVSLRVSKYVWLSAPTPNKPSLCKVSVLLIPICTIPILVPLFTPSLPKPSELTKVVLFCMALCKLATSIKALKLLAPIFHCATTSWIAFNCDSVGFLPS